MGTVGVGVGLRWGGLDWIVGFDFVVGVGIGIGVGVGGWGWGLGLGLWFGLELRLGLGLGLRLGWGWGYCKKNRRAVKQNPPAAGSVQGFFDPLPD